MGTLTADAANRSADVAGQWWYYVERGQKVGPCGLDTLVQLLRAGHLGPEAPVWTGGMATWTPAGAVAPLMQALSPSDRAGADADAVATPATCALEGGCECGPASRRAHRAPWLAVGATAVLAVLAAQAAYRWGVHEGRRERAGVAAATAPARPARPTAGASPRVAASLTAADIAARARAAVVVITGSDVRGREITGSGFFATPNGRVVTNEHVIRDAVRLRVTTSDSTVYDDVGLVAADSGTDLAVLKVPASGARALPIGRQGDLAIGDRIYVMGNPLGFEWTFSDGLLSARRAVDDLTVLQITAPISRGSSGGPVLSQRGAVVGIAQGMFQGGQNLNIAVPAEYAEPLLNAAGEPRPLPAVPVRPARRTTMQPGDPTRERRGDRVTTDLVGRIRVLQREGYRALGSARDRLLDGDSASYLVALASGRSYAVLGACDADCSDLDLVLKDPTGQTVDYDLDADARPVLFVTAADSGRYELVVRMPACTLEPCAFRVALVGRSH